MRYIFALLIPLLLPSCTGDPDAVHLTDPPRPVGPEYVTQIVALEDVVREVRFTGRVVPLQRASISNQVPGKVLPTGKLLQEGKYYRRGEPMIRIDSEQLRYSLRAERAQLITSLTLILSDLSLDYPQAHGEWEAFTRSIDVAEPLPALPKLTDTRLANFIHARAIPAQYYAIRAREATLDDYTVTAPFAGQLTSASVEPGAVVQPGQVLATISRTGTYEVRADLPASVVPALAVGQRLVVYARNIDRSYPATIHRFGPTIDESSQTVTAFLRLSGDQLRSGLYVEGSLPGERLERVAVLPKAALTRSNEVLVIRDSLVATVAVEPVLIEADRVYLAGLSGGERVITEAIDGPVVGTEIGK
jgi:multidrug efflux pump subunit AcrA (membrane-fusion protein)